MKASNRDSDEWTREPKDLIGGLILPIPFLLYGIYCCAQQTAWIPGGGYRTFGGLSSVRLQGGTAIALGVAALSIAVLMFTRLLWRNWFGHWRSAGAIEAVSLLSIAVSMAIVVIRYVSSGRP